MTAVFALPAHAAPAPVRVLFVCEFATAKSAVARELFRQRAAARGLTVKSFSRGLKIEDHMPLTLKARLAMREIDPTRETPQILQTGDMRDADVIVGFTALPKQFRDGDVRDWSKMPSIINDYDRAMLFLDRHVDRLVAEVARTRHGR